MNRLANETSPYLKQHQNNPVDWYPWGQEALRIARETNRPILLSIGYAACHWCHVMAHECFEDPSIAAQMNERFVNIKVDREERPELDKIYQPVAQALTGNGGWPLTVFLTPEQKPFFGGTYFPPEDRFGRPGFPRVLEAVSQAYRGDPVSVADNANRLTEAIRAADSALLDPSSESPISRSQSILQAAELLHKHMDLLNGGIGSAPKFPNAPVLGFLWRAGIAATHEQWRQTVVLTLRKMARGGIYDQLGGGFHRYSVDATWSVPHFEKMLYDNALLLRLYSEVLLWDELSAEDEELFSRVIRETADYLFREMCSPEGLFYSSQDADTDGEEGKYYVFDRDDLERDSMLTPLEVEAVKRRFGISRDGNFEHGKTVLFEADSISGIAAALGISLEDAKSHLQAATVKLRKARERRRAPGRDEKILTSWNALAVSGLAWAYGALQSEDFMHAARTAFSSLVKAVGKDRNYLAGSLQNGTPKTDATLDDYAFMSRAALDLARWSLPEEVALYHSQARAWVDVAVTEFEADAGFYFTGNHHEKLLFRPRALLDSATPAGTSVLLSSALSLAEIQGDTALLARVEEHLSALHSFAMQNPYGAAELLSALQLWTLGPVIVSGTGSERLMRHDYVHRHIDSQSSRSSQTTILVCHQRSCGTPKNEIESAWREVSEHLVFGTGT